MTEVDANVFSKEIFGADMKEVQNAILKRMAGDESATDVLIEKAAEINGTGPEHMNDILDQVLSM